MTKKFTQKDIDENAKVYPLSTYLLSKLNEKITFKLVLYVLLTCIVQNCFSRIVICVFIAAILLYNVFICLKADDNIKSIKFSIGNWVQWEVIKFNHSENAKQDNKSQVKKDLKSNTPTENIKPK